MSRPKHLLPSLDAQVHSSDPHGKKKENTHRTCPLTSIHVHVIHPPHACAYAHIHEHTQIINNSKCVFKENPVHVRDTMLEIFSIFTYSSLVFIRIISLRKPRRCGF